MTCFYYCTGLTSFQWRTMKLACHEQKALSVYYPPFCVVFASDWTSLKAIDYSLAKGKLRHVVRSLCVSQNNVFEEHTSPVSYQETHFTSKLSLCDLRTHFTIMSSLLRDLGGDTLEGTSCARAHFSLKEVQCVKRTDSRLPKRRKELSRFEQKHLFIRDSHSFVFVAALAHNLFLVGPFISPTAPDKILLRHTNGPFISPKKSVKNYTSSSFFNKIIVERSFVTHTQIRHIQNHSPSRFIWLLQSSNSRLLGSLKQ